MLKSIRIPVDRFDVKEVSSFTMTVTFKHTYWLFFLDIKFQLEEIVVKGEGLYSFFFKKIQTTVCLMYSLPSTPADGQPAESVGNGSQMGNGVLRGLPCPCQLGWCLCTCLRSDI